jgi:hypothetical protein
MPNALKSESPQRNIELPKKNDNSQPKHAVKGPLNNYGLGSLRTYTSRIPWLPKLMGWLPGTLFPTKAVSKTQADTLPGVKHPPVRKLRTFRVPTGETETKEKASQIKAKFIGLMEAFGGIGLAVGGIQTERVGLCVVLLLMGLLLITAAVWKLNFLETRGLRAQRVLNTFLTVFGAVAVSLLWLAGRPEKKPPLATRADIEAAVQKLQTKAPPQTAASPTPEVPQTSGTPTSTSRPTVAPAPRRSRKASSSRLTEEEKWILRQLNSNNHAHASTQSKRVTKEELKSILSRKLTNRGFRFLVKQVQQRGVTFPLTPETEQELRIFAAEHGNRSLDLLIDAIRKQELIAKPDVNSRDSSSPSLNQSMINSPGGIQSAGNVTIQTGSRIIQSLVLRIAIEQESSTLVEAGDDFGLQSFIALFTSDKKRIRFGSDYLVTYTPIEPKTNRISFVYTPESPEEILGKEIEFLASVERLAVNFSSIFEQTKFTQNSEAQMTVKFSVQVNGIPLGQITSTVAAPVLLKGQANMDVAAFFKQLPAAYALKLSR